MEPTVLVVDDDKELAGVLAEALAEFGYRVELAHDGVVALQRVRERGAAAIILDLAMPHMDGLQFLGSRRGDDRLARIPVIVLTGEHMMTQKAEALDANVVLEKPVRLLMLLEAIRRVVDGPEPRRHYA
jgi:CheY-like chemotaxis protein